MKNEIKLKPCPFCGGEAKLKLDFTFQQKLVVKQAFVQCRVCYAKTKTFFYTTYEAWENTKRYAVEAWNRRVNDERND